MTTKEGNPKLVDFHCHLDLYPDLASAIAECEREQVYTLTVTTTPRAWPRNQELAKETKYVRVALGLHPQLVADRATEITLWEEFLPNSKYIGEVGLDAGPQYFKSFDLQKDVFRKILKSCARIGGKVISVHSVRAAKHVLDLIEAELPPDRGRIVLHWFTGSKSEARRAIDLGCFFSINAEMFRSDRHRELLTSIPRDRILTETDGPFTKIEGRPARPSDVMAAVGMLANAFGTTTEQMAKIIYHNLSELISGVE